MELLELSKKDLIKIDKELYEKVLENYNYDLVIFIARGSYIIGKHLSEMNNCPLIEIFATRKGGMLKKILRPILQCIPTRLKKILREKEFNSNIHEKKYERSITFDDKIWAKYKNSARILIVDDSVDTGYSIKFVREVVCKYFDKSEIKVCAINVFDKSKNVVTTDFYLYENTLLKGPWSNDSSENKKYIQEYNEWHKNQVV